MESHPSRLPKEFKKKEDKAPLRAHEEKRKQAMSTTNICAGALQMLLVPEDDNGETVCVARSPIHVRMRYLRKVYFILALQQFLLGTTSFMLFMTSGVRPFVQNFNSVIWSTAVLLIISFFCLRHAANHAPRLAGLAFFLFSLVLALTCTVVTAYMDTEFLYTLCFMNGFVFLFHCIYCVQTVRPLQFKPSSLFTILLSLVEAWFLDSLLMKLNFDYISHVVISSVICIYVHWNILYFSHMLTTEEVIQACIKVFVSLPKLF
ncbi:unnamed protein product [Cylicocyclus nassatus]|uniref:Uncharacterized protein n=1 Tax=Cylicocyclus nassatus TaxID=53992 RepID=A0AA36DLL7_CYLNA|nr:unnamed protein product [Cylicocyclus nassatus]